ncbi:MAG: acyltransferase [Chromatiales bacterium]|nr:acyltransferase [Gammaproteobacteria bacterium]MCP5351954.1 acyltransferase [Chromatiales bacterium]
MYLNSFNHFRALAIVVIVAGHTIWTVDWRFDSLTQRFLIDLVSGGSTLFVFISGFLYHHIFYRRGTPYARFLRDKARNVLTPYLVLTVPTLAIYYALPGWAPRLAIFADPEGGFWGRYLWPLLADLATGRATHAYWYIPFVMALFVLTPLFDRAIRASSALRWALFGIGTVVAMLIHRPIENLNLLHSLVYFAPVYLFGILCSIHHDAILRRFAGWRVYGLLALVIAFALGHAIWRPEVLGNFHKPAFQWGGIDLMLPQTLLLNVFFMVWLARFENRDWPLVHRLASASFSIYFLHALLLVFASPLVHAARIGWPVLDWLSTTAITVAASFAIAWFVQRTWPTASRRLIGW